MYERFFLAIFKKKKLMWWINKYCKIVCFNISNPIFFILQITIISEVNYKTPFAQSSLLANLALHSLAILILIIME